MARQVLTVPDVPGALLTEVEGDARYPLRADVNPYPQYTTDAEVTAAISAHAALADPHPVYALDGDVTAAISAHAAAANPHTVYLLSATAASTYLTQASAASTYLTQANATSTYVPLAGGSVMTGALGPTTNNARDLGTTALRWRKLWGVDADLSATLVVATSVTVASKAVALSPNANQTLQWLANGFFHDGPTKATYDALVARVAALEAQMGAGANGHYHLLGTWRQTQKATIPITVLETQEAPVG